MFTFAVEIKQFNDEHTPFQFVFLKSKKIFTCQKILLVCHDPFAMFSVAILPTIHRRIDTISQISNFPDFCIREILPQWLIFDYFENLNNGQINQTFI